MDNRFEPSFHGALAAVRTGFGTTWITRWFSTTYAYPARRQPWPARISPAVHGLSTPHPDANVEIIPLTFSPNTLSLWIMLPTLSQAYITVV